MTLNEAVQKLNEMKKSAYALGHAQSILYTDGDTVAPKNSWKGRGMALAYLSELTYRQMVNPETGEILETILQHKDETDEVTYRQAEIMKEGYDNLHVLPMEEYVAYQELTNESSAVWHEAKLKSDWAMFSPYLEKIIAARRRFAALKSPEKPAYDVLMDQYEKGANMRELDPFFRTLREELSPVIREVAAREKPVPAFMKGPWPIEKQRLFSNRIMALEGIDPLNCTLGETEHPFTDGTVYTIDENIEGTSEYKTKTASFSATDEIYYFKYDFAGSLPTSLITAFKLDITPYTSEMNTYKVYCTNVLSSTSDADLVSQLTDVKADETKSTCTHIYQSYGYHDSIMKLDNSKTKIGIAVPSNASRIIPSPILCCRLHLGGMIDVPVMWQIHILPP